MNRSIEMTTPRPAARRARRPKLMPACPRSSVNRAPTREHIALHSARIARAASGDSVSSVVAARRGGVPDDLPSRRHFRYGEIFRTSVLPFASFGIPG
jgi:hypothetical protein